LCHTYRFRGHHVGDINRPYRSTDEEQSWINERDPIGTLARWLSQEGIADGADLERIEQRIRMEIDAGLRVALNAPYPDPREVTTDVYA
jgi:pyruvate dehydrogenase E1 component alpha subunit